MHACFFIFFLSNILSDITRKKHMNIHEYSIVIRTENIYIYIYQISQNVKSIQRKKKKTPIYNQQI